MSLKVPKETVGECDYRESIMMFPAFINWLQLKQQNTAFTHSLQC